MAERGGEPRLTMTFDPVAIVERAFSPSKAGVEAWVDEVGRAVREAVVLQGGAGCTWINDGAPRRVSDADEACAVDPPWSSPGLSTASVGGGELRWVVTPPGPLQVAFAALSVSTLPPDDARRRLWRYLAVHLALGLLEAADHGLVSRPLRDAAEELAVWRRVLIGVWRFVEHRAAAGYLHVVAEECPAADGRLTRRQRQVAFYASLGCSNKEIGYHLALAENTVSAHLQRAMAKMGITDRSELVRLAGRVTANAEVSLTAGPRISGVIRI